MPWADVQVSFWASNTRNITEIELFINRFFTSTYTFLRFWAQTSAQAVVLLNDSVSVLHWRGKCGSLPCWRPGRCCPWLPSSAALCLGVLTMLLLLPPSGLRHICWELKQSSLNGSLFCHSFTMHLLMLLWLDILCKLNPQHFKHLRCKESM